MTELLGYSRFHRIQRCSTSFRWYNHRLCCSGLAVTIIPFRSRNEQVSTPGRRRHNYSQSSRVDRLFWFRFRRGMSVVLVRLFSFVPTPLSAPG
ncbi:hypothetical protein T10_2420 [Trichinella papuae]|uniref:Uncharacterized protein n=1 Tax=Trichinella papuae TaxID=268474 RepID=A0A0V1MFD2_9BILA|nr:hypothetical protein T10_2420 [Trichinella papuae]